MSLGRRADFHYITLLENMPLQFIIQNIQNNNTIIYGTGTVVYSMKYIRLLLTIQFKLSIVYEYIYSIVL